MTISSSINNNLPFIALATSTCFISILLYRVVHILTQSIIITILKVRYSTDRANYKTETALKKYARNGFITQTVQFASSIVYSCIDLVFTFLRIIVLVSYLLLPFVILSLALVIIEQKWTTLLRLSIDIFNETLGPTVKGIIAFPLNALDTIGTHVIPVFNLIFFILVRTPLHMLFSSFMTNGSAGSGYHIVQSLKLTGQSFPLLFSGIEKFIDQNSMEGCLFTQNSGLYCSNVSGICRQIGTTTMADGCLDSQRRKLDLDPMFTNLRLASGHAIMTIGKSCEAVAMIANISLFPLSDIAFWNATSTAINSILNALVVAPITAYHRCQLAGGISKRPAMCTPDFGPSFEMAADSAILLGEAITNWMDVLYLLVSELSPLEIRDACSSSKDYVNVFNEESMIRKMMGHNSTVIVRMTKDTFAVTDGSSVIYVDESAGLRQSYAPQAWQKPVNPEYGIARTLLPSGVNVNDDGVALFGCHCIDNNSTVKMLKIECTTLTKSGNTWTFPIQWSLESEPRTLQSCSKVRVVVQSIRRHSKRVSTANVMKDKINRFHKELSADVAVYIIPVCGADTTVACFEEKYYTRGICFPYCMGLRMRHESFQPLTMRGAMEWKEGVFIAERNCILSSQIRSGQITSKNANLHTYCSTENMFQSSLQESATYTVIKEGEKAVCSYDSTCTSILNDKQHSAYATADQLDIPIIETLNNGQENRLILNGQPLVIGGGTFMRMYAIDGNNYIDFPTIVGDQYNEFTIEYHATIGFPVASLSTTPSKERNFHNQRKGEMFVPAEYVQKRVPYNPGTISSESMWYVTNPSYEWAAAFINYCATEGVVTQTQIMLTSSYSPLTLWKVRYQDVDNLCYINTQGKRICQNDISESSPIDTHYEFPLMDSGNDFTSGGGLSLYSLCKQKKEFNLWAENVEDFNEYNILVSVRRGSIEDMGFLLSTSSGESLLKTRGRTIFYFVFKYNMTRSQVGVPFTRKDFLVMLHGNEDEPSIQIFDTACPSLRTLPNVGGILGHSIAAVIYLFKTPVNLLLNPFAVNELLVSRYQKKCPENGLVHSMFNNCGMAMVSLNPFFESIYTASHIFWDMISWVTQSVLLAFQTTSTLEDSSEMKIFKDFLQGGQIVGDASKLVVMFEIVRSIDVFDNKYQDAAIEKSSRRRHLLSSYIRSVSGGLQKGASSMFSLSKSVFSAFAAAPFAGADLSILLATNDPRIYIAGSSITAPSIAWVHFSYEAFVPVVLDLLANLRENTFTLQPLWVHMFEAYDKYEEIIHKRHLQACSGLRLMFGYSSKYGKGIYYNCLAATSLLQGTLELVLNIFVDLPLYRCMCVHPAGQNYGEYVYNNCEYLIPSTHKSKWQAFLSEALKTNIIQPMCEDYFKKIEKKMYEVFDPWTQNSIIAVDNLGSFLNEMMTSDTRSCNDIQSNPTAMLLTPLPIHHFHVCSKTKICRDKCRDSIEAFEYQYKRMLNSVQYNPENSQLGKREVINVAVESPLFNKFNTDGSSLNLDGVFKNSLQKTIKAIKTVRMSQDSKDIPEACMQRCNDNGENTCVSVLSEQSSQDMYTVEFMCIPKASNIMGTIFHTRLNSYQIKNIREMIQDSGESSTLNHVEFSMHEGANHILTYSTKKAIAVNIRGEQTISFSNYVNFWYLLGNNNIQSKRIVRSEDLKEKFMSTTMQEALFGSTIVSPSISNCQILEVVEIKSHERGHLHMFLSFRVQVEANIVSPADNEDVEQNKVQTDIQGHRIHASIDVCDDVIATCKDTFNFFLPCTSPCRGTISACTVLCRESVDQLLYMGERGSFQHIQNNTYFYIPSTSSYESSENDDDLPQKKAGILLIHPFHGIIRKRDSSSSVNNVFIRDFNIASLSNQKTTMLGSWTRSEIFSDYSILSNIIRDNRAYSSIEGNAETVPVTYFQVSSGGSSEVSASSEWLQQTRLELMYSGWTLKTYTSQKARVKTPFYINCSIHSCAGCGNTMLRLFCHAAQDCTLTKCIGTVVQTRNVLCGIGGFFEQICNNVIVSWNAIYLSIAEIVLILSKNMNANEAARVISLKFPTEQFYGLVCSCKEMYGKNIGLILSAVQMIYSNIFQGQIISSGGLDLAGKQDIGILVGEETMKSASLANLLFNVITGSTLMPIMALHRWLICTANASLITEEEGSISVQFEDVAMDTTWLPCARVNGIAKILGSVDIQHSVESNVDMFVSFSMSLLSGLGETALYAIQLSYEAILDFFISVIWSLQDILYTFNLRSCKVPNYALRYVLWCSCNDTAYQIPEKNRAQKWDSFWCVGTLNMNLMDGTANAIIFNPYSLQELTQSVKYTVAYIECISIFGANSDKCASIISANSAGTSSTLDVLVKQGVEPIAVWAKCKANYLQGTWDIGSGALFMGKKMSSSSSQFQSAVYAGVPGMAALQTEYAEWAKTQIGGDFLECMRDEQRLQIDYSACMRMYFDRKFGQTPNSYFIYEKTSSAPLTQDIVPDACLVFSGLNASSVVGSSFQTKMHHCIMQEGVSESHECDLNPAIWSNKNPQKMSIAKLHGTSSPLWKTAENGNPLVDSRNSVDAVANELYKAANKSLHIALERFFIDFPKEENNIDAMLFSADGDFIHEFFDCIFLGPYNRVDLMPCDREGVLECPFYARDEEGGKTRKFTACFGDIMHGDEKLPFTCGSQVRRSIIKYFYRTYSSVTNREGLSKNISKEIFRKVIDIVSNFTSEKSRGCYNDTSKTCHIEACTAANGYAPCMNTDFQISEKEVGKFIIENILKEVDPYIQEVFTNPEILTSKYDNSNTSVPFQWQNSRVALELSIFDPSKPTVKYDTTETYKMPIPSTEMTSEEDKMQGSIWGMCMSLLSHAAMTLPIESFEMPGTEKARTYELPVGARSQIISLLKQRKNNVDTNENNIITLEIIEEIVRDIVDASMKSHSPFIWHKFKRHAPSVSNFCKPQDPSMQSRQTPPPGKLSIGSVSLFLPDNPDDVYEIRPVENIHIPFYGFSEGTIAESNSSCICAVNHRESRELCQIQDDTCQTLTNHSAFTDEKRPYLQESCSILDIACRTLHKTYPRRMNGVVMDCLMSLKNEGEHGIRCPEMSPSDTWGYFPVDCSDNECDGANRWMGRGSEEQILYEGSRLLNEGRGGFRLPNYKHVLHTYHNHIHYGVRKHKPEAYQIPECFTVENLAPNEMDEQEQQLTSEVLQRLFPATQLVFDSPASSICTRYIIEYTKLQAIMHIKQSQNTNNEHSTQRVRVETWKRKCESKVRHVSMCNMLGMYFEVKPPTVFHEKSMAKCKISIDQQGNDRYYMTPECVIVDRQNRRFFDAHLCAKIANRISIVDSSTDISDDCALIPQPTELLREERSIPYSMLFSSLGHRLLSAEFWIEELSKEFDILKVKADAYRMHTTTRDHVSYVLDWWPEEIPKEGHHITSPTDPSELAPILFDSHYLYNKEDNTIHYVHTSLRNASLLYNALGAVGICRMHTIGMPMFDANTNRICTRMSKRAKDDTPTHPTIIDTPKEPGGNEERWPFSNSYMDTYFEKEVCAETARDVPWQSEDVASQSAGNIPGWNSYVFMDSRGRTFYTTESEVFPPHEQVLNHLFSDSRAWGPCDIHWQPAPSCSLDSPCTENAACLPVKKLDEPSNNNNSASTEESVVLQQHTCFSTRAYLETARKQSNMVREPCFATFHCPDGKVCLADGGCAPLYLHMWNPKENESPLEFTVIADSCGFQKTNHPFTQNTRGASPWEQVPDILHSHGFCSHHNWFSYRNSIKGQICPIVVEPSSEDATKGSSSYMKCNVNTTLWPWIFERFDRKKPSASVNEERQNMGEGKFLSTKPHPCDQTFMHLQNPIQAQGENKRRLEVCSGFQGEERSINSKAYFSYSLDSSRGTWDDVVLFRELQMNSSAALSWSASERWLRTYTEATNEIDIGMIHHEKEYDTAFGFLGASKTESDIRGSMAMHQDKISFFRCETTNACGSPPHTYNGISVLRRGGPSTTPQSSSNISETSLRLCGSIGFLSTTSDSICELDILSFPIVSFILWRATVDQQLQTCKTLFSSTNFDSVFVKNDGSENEIQSSIDARLLTTSSSQSFTCDRYGSQNERGKCMYAARPSARLSNTYDHITYLTSNLNSLLVSTRDNIERMIQEDHESASVVYETINGCTSMLLEHMLLTQSDIQEAYESLGPSGIYIALKITLYEVPLAWFQHAMYISLLSQIYPAVVQRPPLEMMMSTGKLDLLMWEESEKTVICRDNEDILMRPLLVKIICLNAHPEYSFSPQRQVRKGLIENIISKTQSDVQNQFVESTEELKVFCHDQVSWDCFSQYNTACVNAQIMSHEPAACEENVIQGDSSFWLHPCKHPELFRLGNPKPISLKEIEMATRNPSLVRSFEYFAYNSKNILLRNAENVAQYIDFVKENTESNIIDLRENTMNEDEVSIVRVWSMDARDVNDGTQNFNMTRWLTEDVCEARFQPTKICTNQYDVIAMEPEASCMYPFEFNSEDFFRYTKNTETFVDDSDQNATVIKVFYANGETETIRVCNLDTEAESCFTQNLEKMESIISSSSEGGDNIIPCGIVALEVPPGIEVKAFGLSLTEEEWNNRIDLVSTTRNNIKLGPTQACSTASAGNGAFSSSQIYPCTWTPGSTSGQYDQWWYYGNVHKGMNDDPKNTFANIDYLNRSNPLHTRFDDMDNWWRLSDEWTKTNKGCKQFKTGICSFKIRFENVQGVSKAVCGNDALPNCGLLVNQESSLFATSSLLSTDPSQNLFRCAPCTKMKNKIADQGLFGCFVGTNPEEGPKETLTHESIQSTTQYLSNEEEFQRLWGGRVATKTWLNGSSSIEVRYLLQQNINPLYTKSLLKWGKSTNALVEDDVAIQEEKCGHTTPSLCWKGMDMRYTMFRDQEIWNKAVTNPSLSNTMICQEKMYTEKDARQCNNRLDARRQKLSKFVDNQYRKKNGVWLQKVDRGVGSMWQANVAHSKVNMFSIMFSSSNRPNREVLAKWVLGEHPCDPQITIHQDRICVSTTVSESIEFQALHPWIGGDFNPFEGTRGLDECTTPKLFSGGQTRYMCPCKCEPSYACENNLVNYTERYMDSEFYAHESCNNLKFPESHIMNEDDDSNLCSVVRKRPFSAHCSRRQGLFAGTLIRKSISEDELHSYSGIPTDPAEFLVQSLLDMDKNGLWMGKTITEESQKNEKYAFLKMSRENLNPAHVAFGIDMSKSDWPLVIKAISLLTHTDHKAIPKALDDLNWLKDLKRNVLLDGEKAKLMYPQLAGRAVNVNHWSCPLRIFTFWGNSGSENFSPLTPNPLLSKLIYREFNGAHPFVPLQNLLGKLGKYKTTNGACFYEDDSKIRLNTIHVSNADSPCGIKRMLRNLNSETPAISQVMNHIRDACREIMDHPNIGTQLRTNERIEDSFNGTCGVLHRLTPFLIRTRGSQGTITKYDTLTTSSEGGDCHMGRAFVQQGPISNIIGRHCSLIEKNETQGQMYCATSFKDRFPQSPTTLLRVKALNIAEILKKKIDINKKPMYLDEINTLQNTRMPPTFFGPGKMQLEIPEVSFGLLYTPSILQMLAVDLRMKCKVAMQSTCVLVHSENLWKGKYFLSNYMNGNLTEKNAVDTEKTETFLGTGETHYEHARTMDNDLWNTSNWTWSTQAKVRANYSSSQTSIERQTYGNVNRYQWMNNRFQACNSSFHQYFDTSEVAGELSVRNIPLCEPAPTSSLQNLCKALLQYRQDIALINCQLTGNGDCLFNPGMFYLPYMWSVTNQEFSAETVHNYYEEVASANSITSDEFNNLLCPARNDMLKQLAKMSRETAKQCPGAQIEYLKDTLENLKSIGYKLIYMCYAGVMFIISMLASLFSSSQEAMSAAATSANFYLQGFIQSISESILPILDAFVSIIFGTSPVGKSFKVVLVKICEMFNTFLEKWWVPHWCVIIKPSLYGIFQFLQGAATFFNSGAGEKIQNIWRSIAGDDNGGVNIQSCMAGFPRLPCDTTNNRKQVNESQFLVQPMATRCWIDSTTKTGFSIFTGNSQNDFLTCTVSDTCALESTKFDLYYGNDQNLIACASCPSVDLSTMSNRFGCNTYLKRCTCGISSGRASQCLVNSDCQKQDLTVCSIASNVDSIRTAQTTLPCKQCTNVGTEATCVIDGVSARGSPDSGVCACVSIFKSESLQQCDTAMVGSPISLMRSSQSMCFISSNSLMDEYSTMSNYVDFSELAIGPCALGITNNYCLFVQLPISSSSGGSQFSFSYVVVNQLSTSTDIVAQQQRRRNLLSLSEGSSHIQLLDNDWNFTSNVFNEWCSVYTQNWTNQSPERRNQMKECFHKVTMVNHLIHDFNVTLSKENMKIIFTGSFLTPEYIFMIMRNPEILPFILRHGQSYSTSNQNSLLTIGVHGALHISHWVSKYFLHSTSFLNMTTNHSNGGKTEHLEKENNSYCKHKSARRNILSVDTELKPTILPTIECSVIEEPLKAISSAFWDTVQFYKSKDHYTHGTRAIWNYNFPTSYENSKNKTIESSEKKERGNFGSLTASILSWSIFGENITGQLIIDSLASEIPYNVSVSENLFTGTRLAREITSCNYTLLTLQSENTPHLLSWSLILFITFLFTTTTCCSSPIIATMAWVILFPMTLFWAVYNTSPMCWPMIPPRFAKDLSMELLKLIPEKVQIPYFLVHEDCISTVDGKVEMSKQVECFKECSAEPFYMKSWQDPFAWWVCETSETVCSKSTALARSWNVLQDYSSSGEYFMDVLKRKDTDPDFVQAHRFCALLTSYEITFALFVALTVLLIIPSCIEFIIKTFSGAIILLLHASNAEYTDDEERG